MTLKKDYKTWLGKLSLYAAFFCSILPHATKADDDLFDRWQKKTLDFLTNSKSTVSEPAPWSMRLPSVNGALSGTNYIKHSNSNSSLNKMAYKSFLTAAGLPSDYLINDRVIKPIHYSSGPSAAGTRIAEAEQKPSANTAIGFLDDPAAPVYVKTGHKLKLVQKDSLPLSSVQAKLESMPAHHKKLAPANAVRLAQADTILPAKNASAVVLPDDQVIPLSPSKAIANHPDPKEVKEAVIQPIDRTHERLPRLPENEKTADTRKTKPVESVSAVTGTKSTLPWLTQANIQVASSSPVPLTTAKIEPLRNESSTLVVAENDANDLPPVLLTPPKQSTTATPLASQPETGVSEQSRNILKKLPAEKIRSNEKPENIDVAHTHKNPLEDEVKKHNGIGIEMSVRKPRANISRLLENAYDALIAGNQEEAIGLYKQVLEAQPSNELGLFGLATTYHRAGQIQMARPLYGKLLAIDPHNVEGLNNFLVLLSDEDPKDALAELDKLEKSHPGFSPIPAQMAIIYEKMGNYDLAMDKMNRAISLSPENLKYRYDMAIILDKKGDWANAAVFYKQLLIASERGERISASPEEIQHRLTFIQSNKPKG